MSEEHLIRVNFGRPIPVFPLQSVSLLPHGILPLHIFEPRYRQMVSDVLDGPGQIALAVFKGDRWRSEYEGNPPIRPAVCIGQIVQHRKLPGGMYDIAVQGVCRAKVLSEHMPDETRFYREALLEPVGIEQIDEASLSPARETIRHLLDTGPLTELRDSARILEHLADPDIPTSALLELLTLSFIDNQDVRYRLLAEPAANRRAELVLNELNALQELLRRAAPQRIGNSDAPKGCSWN